jgi:cystathionine gamma-lyase
MSFSFVDFNVDGALEAAIRPRTKLIWLETPTNPTLKIVDIRRTCEIAHKHGKIVCVDNTFMSPYFQSPLALGCDLVMHSVTKYINGHSDVVMGAVATNSETLYTKLKA